MENTKESYNIAATAWAMAPGAPDNLEPAEDDAPSAYVVRVSVEWDNCRHAYIDGRNEAEIWTECLLVKSEGRMLLKTIETWKGQRVCWSGDYVGRVGDNPEIERLCDRAQEAVERYLDGKSSAWWKRIRSSVLRSPCLDAVLSVRLPRRKGYTVLARVELVTIGR